jgi:eukaryotic-like serine/threonine-protein kinase
MSPEQAEGKKVDARSDIFSFGVLLYEMLTGRRAFQGESKMATLAAILNREPEPVEKLNDAVPRDLMRVVQRCLRKDPERRAHSMQDLKLALEEIKEDSESGLILPHAGGGAAQARQRNLGPLLIAGLGVVLAAAGAGYWWLHGAAKADPMLQATPLTTFPGYERYPTFSPDGNQVAFSWGGNSGDNVDIYVQLIGSGRPLRLTTDEGRDISPAWSPDGRTIAFARIDASRHVTVMLIPALGGAEREVATLGLVMSAGLFTVRIVNSWSSDGRWLVISDWADANSPTALYLVSVETGEKRRLTSPPDNASGDYSGAISPDGRTMVFLRIAKGVGTASYLSDVYTLALTPDLRPAGEPRRITSDSATVRATAWAAGGNDVIFSSNRSGSPGLWRIDASGREKPRRLPVGDGGATLAISPRAGRMVYEQAVSLDSNIWRLDVAAPGTPPTRFITSTRQDESPAYSPDGKRIAFRSDRSGVLEIWTCDEDGSNAAQLTRTPTAGSPHWSPDSRQITFDATVDGRWQVFVIPSRGGPAKKLTTDGGTRPSFSHDGQWIYFSNSTKGQTDVWKMALAGGTPLQVTKNGGSNAVETPDGSLFYITNRGIMRSAPDGTGETMIAQAGSSTLHVPTQDGIYYRAPPPSGELRFFNFTSKSSKLVFQPPTGIQLGITVSPDKRWLLYSQVDGAPGSDLMLVENFR